MATTFRRGRCWPAAGSGADSINTKLHGMLTPLAVPGDFRTLALNVETPSGPQRVYVSAAWFPPGGEHDRLPVDHGVTRSDCRSVDDDPEVDGLTDRK
jgi:hypothetical protein